MPSTHINTCATGQIHSEKCQQCGSSVVSTFSSVSTLQNFKQLQFYSPSNENCRMTKRMQRTLYLLCTNSHCTDHGNNKGDKGGNQVLVGTARLNGKLHEPFERQLTMFHKTKQDKEASNTLCHQLAPVTTCYLL
jgi:hypothetical protein